VSRPNRKPSWRYDFQLAKTEIDPRFEKDVNLKLVELLALAPPDASATGVLEKCDQFYWSSVAVESRYCNFQEKAAGTTPHSAVARALEKLENKLYEWRN